MSSVEATYNERVLLVAPTNKDELVTRRLLEGAQIEVDSERDFPRIAEMVAQGVGALLITDLTLSRPGVQMLMTALKLQPTWSAVPVVALCRQGAQVPAVAQLLQQINNVTILDRPISTRGLLSALAAAQRARRLQYVIRDQIQQLQQAEEALRHADRKKDEFLATLGHELRNPLAPMRTGLAVLQRIGSQDDRATRVHSMMDRQLTLLVKLIDELLDISRIATGKIVLRSEVVDMCAIVREVLESCEPGFRANALELQTDIPLAPLNVLGDVARLSQIVINLVGNAVKYTPSGGLVRVSLLRDGSQVVLRVADNGLGIPAALLEQVFEMFAQVSQTLDRSQGGLGIGLSLARRLAELHGGSVIARSEGTGRGSTFELSLPLAAEHPAVGTSALPVPVANATSRPLKILVIDDNVDAADALGLLLESLGHKAQVAYGGGAGVDAFYRFGPEAVFCDIGMPGVDGFEVAARIRSDSRSPAPVLIALTGLGTDADRERTRAACYDFHLTKPADLESVRGILQNM